MRLSSVCALSWNKPALEQAAFLVAAVFVGQSVTDSSLGKVLDFDCDQAPTKKRPWEAAVPVRLDQCLPKDREC